MFFDVFRFKGKTDTQEAMRKLPDSVARDRLLSYNRFGLRGNYIKEKGITKENLSRGRLF